MPPHTIVRIISTSQLAIIRRWPTGPRALIEIAHPPSTHLHPKSDLTPLPIK